MSLESLPWIGFLGRYVDLAAVLAAVLAAYDRFGYALVFLGAMLEHTVLLGLVIPGGTMVSLGGAAAKLGSLRLPLTIACGAAGILTGASIDYWLGRTGLLRLLLRTRFGPRLRPSLDRAAVALRRHGWWAITAVYAVGAGRSAVALAAGACRLPYWRFVLYELPAAVLWSAAFNLVGYGVATNLDAIAVLLQRVGAVLVVLLALGLLARWLWRRRATSASRAAVGQPMTPEPQPVAESAAPPP